MAFYKNGFVNFKVVLDGLGLSGKKSIIHALAEEFPCTPKFENPTWPESRYPISWIREDEDRGFFMYGVPLEVDGILCRFFLYTRFHFLNAELSRKVIYKGVDALIYVVDARVDRLEGSLKGFQDVEAYLDRSVDRDKLCRAVQYHCWDLPEHERASIETLEATFNKGGFPAFYTSCLDKKGLASSYAKLLVSFFREFKEKGLYDSIRRF